MDDGRYFVAHVSRLNYRDRPARGQAIGSGVVEGGSKDAETEGSWAPARNIRTHEPWLH